MTEASHSVTGGETEVGATGDASARVASPRHRSQRWVVLALAAGQLVSSAVVFVGYPDALGSTSDPGITPPGYAFSIWLIPIVGCLLYAVLNLRAATAKEGPFTAIAWPLCGAMAGFSIWLWFALTGWVWATAVVFLAMLGFLARAMAPLRTTPERAREWVPYITVGVYTGWTTVAVWVNLAVAVKRSGAGDGLGWQLAILASAAVSAFIGIRLSRVQWAYLAAIAWAFVGVVVSTVTQDKWSLAAAAGVALAANLLTAALTHRRARTPPPQRNR